MPRLQTKTATTGRVVLSLAPHTRLHARDGTHRTARTRRHARDGTHETARPRTPTHTRNKKRRTRDVTHQRHAAKRHARDSKHGTARTRQHASKRHAQAGKHETASTRRTKRKGRHKTTRKRRHAHAGTHGTASKSRQRHDGMHQPARARRNAHPTKYPPSHTTARSKYWLWMHNSVPISVQTTRERIPLAVFGCTAQSHSKSTLRETRIPSAVLGCTAECKQGACRCDYTCTVGDTTETDAVILNLANKSGDSRIKRA